MRTDELPRISVGQLRVLLECQRRLSIWLSDEKPRYTNLEGRFRLMRAVTEALTAAHQRADDGEGSIDELIDHRPPPELSHEERVRFAEALGHYGEFAEGRPARLVESPSGWKRTSATKRFELTGDPRVLVRRVGDDELELRRVMLVPSDPGRAPRATPTRTEIGYGALIGTPLTVVRMRLVSPIGIDEVEVTAAHVAELREQVNARVESAVTSGDEAMPTPGWWCRGCASIVACAGVHQRPIDALLRLVS